jgi:hypothetical protein
MDRTSLKEATVTMADWYQKGSFRAEKAVFPFPEPAPLIYRYSNWHIHTVNMKCLATLLYPLVTIIISINTVIATDQIVIPNVLMDADRPTSHGQPTLFDLLTVEPNTSIFFSYVREIELVRLFMNADSNVTVLVPTNKAVMALEKKP